MKLRYFTLALTTAALLPTLAFAGDNMDAISASFDRDLNREIKVEYVPSAGAITDPLDAINIALRAEPDQVLASFYRDLHRVPTTTTSVIMAGEPDPLDAINVALRNESIKFVEQVAIVESNRHVR